MGIIVDTSVFIAFERAGTAIDLNVHPEEEAFISSITASELLVGVHRASNPQRKARRQAFVEAILTSFPSISVDEKVARTHAILLAEQLRTGTQSGAHDALIAATAIAYGYSVLTRDVEDFQRMPGLQVIDAG